MSIAENKYGRLGELIFGGSASRLGCRCDSASGAVFAGG